MDTSTLEETKFFVPSETLTSRIADRIESLGLEATRALNRNRCGEPIDSSPGKAATNDELGEISNRDLKVLHQRRFLAEALYYFLAQLSESREAGHGQKLCITKWITNGMANTLGLADNDDLLKEFSDEFQLWLAKTGNFTAGWGEIIWAGDSKMYLAAFQVEVDSSNQFPSNFRFSHYHLEKAPAKPRVKTKGVSSSPY